MKRAHANLAGFAAAAENARANPAIAPTIVDLLARPVVSNGAPAPVSPVGAASVSTPPLRRGRQPNKTELRWLATLAIDPAVKRATFEGVTLRLADGVRYTPDVLVEYTDGAIGLDEVKGAFIRPDALMKLRMAVSAFPCFRWRLAQWSRGRWNVREDGWQR